MTVILNSSDLLTPNSPIEDWGINLDSDLFLSEGDCQHRGARNDREATVTASVNIALKVPADDGKWSKLEF
jgi:hypothetical protein